MERQGTHTSTKQAEELEAFLQFGKATSHAPNCITPLANLPIDYRQEIDRGFSTGWECLDMYLQGLRKGEMTVVTADTGAGKTSFCTHLLVNCAMQNVPVWINSWEMKPEITMRKIASILLRKPMKLQRFSPAESEEFDKFARHYKIYINPHTIGTDINSLSQQLIIAKRIGIEIVMLDHLDYLVSSKKEKMHEAIDETIKKLHELAFALDMHFVLICHPRQTFDGKEEIGMHSLKGSSSIKQYADNIITLHRCSRTDAQADPSKVKIKVCKNRLFGIEGVTYLYYQASWDGYLELKEFME